MITARNTVLVPVKTGVEDGFAVNAYDGATGGLIWSLATDYQLPSHNWTPPMGITLTSRDASVVIPGAGGTVWIRSAPNSSRGTVTRSAFFNVGLYNQAPAAFNNAIQICTPITCDKSGNLDFGYLSSGATIYALYPWN